MTDADSDEQVERLLIYIFEKSKLRDLIAWLKVRFWKISERGVFGWLGDKCDDAEHALMRRKVAKRLRARRRAKSNG